jgi:hypothetical protein
MNFLGGKSSDLFWKGSFVFLEADETWGSGGKAISEGKLLKH